MTALGDALTLQPGLPGPAATRRHVANGLTVGVILSGAFILLLVVAAAWPSLLASSSPLSVNLADAFHAPSLAHLFGTDESGRDVFTRVVYGARQSLGIGVAATTLALLMATILGVLAGLGGRFLDGAINR